MNNHIAPSSVGTSGKYEAMLNDAYELWLRAPHPKKPGALNRDRSRPDLLNHRRGLYCFAAGFSNGTKLVDQIPLGALEIAEVQVAQYVSRGATLLALHGSAKHPSKKTVSNLISCLRAIRAVVLKDRNVPIQGKSARKRLAELPKRRSRARFPIAKWPEQFSAEWQEYRAWKIKPMLTPSEGASYRRDSCRPRTIDGSHVAFINSYIGFLVRECGMKSFGLVEACDLERFGEFVNWHLVQDADGGYVHLKNLAAVMATISRHLVAKHVIPELTDGIKPWDVFYDIGKEVMRLGASKGYIVTARDVGNWKPSDLVEIGKQGWDQAPIHGGKNSPYVHTAAVFNRKRTSLFFYLSPETPLRARNWLEMVWHKHLVRTEGDQWKVRFVGDELKIGRRGYTTNVYELVYSAEASRMIDQWRDVLKARFGADFEAISPNVFPPSHPNRQRSSSQLSYSAFAQGVKLLVMDLRNETFHPHKIRHIVGSYLVNELGAGGLGLAAKLLGDTPQVVLDAYYRPNTQKDLASYIRSIR